MCTKLEKGVRLTQIFLSFCLVAGGLLIIIPLAIVKSDFNGHCPLYGNVENDSPRHFIVKQGSKVPCNFIFGVTGVLCAVTGLLMGIMQIIHACRQGWETGFMDRCSCLLPVVYSIRTGLVLVVAILLSVGLQSFCNSFKEGFKKAHMHYTSCRDVQTALIWSDMDGSRFYDFLTFAKMAAWACLIVLVLQTLCATYLAARGGCCRRGKKQEDAENLPKAESVPAGTQRAI